MLVTPLMLDAAWSIVPAACVAAAMAVRTALEDRTLQERLPGYPGYCTSVRYRLIPGVW
jgi:protein-S-isoprenylcysteine O-methyltransferase Ste14